jgi:hypothetical protein
MVGMPITGHHVWGPAYEHDKYMTTTTSNQNTVIFTTIKLIARNMESMEWNPNGYQNYCTSKPWTENSSWNGRINLQNGKNFYFFWLHHLPQSNPTWSTSFTTYVKLRFFNSNNVELVFVSLLCSFMHCDNQKQFKEFLCKSHQ